MIDHAILNALERTHGKSVSDGVIVVGMSATHVAIAFNSTPGNENQVVTLTKDDAARVVALLSAAAAAHQGNYFDTLAGALNAALGRASQDGAEFDPAELGQFLGVFYHGGVAYGQTLRHAMPVVVRRGSRVLNLHWTVVIYRMESGTYELTSYIN